jgi:hypothetical protein
LNATSTWEDPDRAGTCAPMLVIAMSGNPKSSFRDIVLSSRGTNQPMPTIVVPHVFQLLTDVDRWLLQACPPQRGSEPTAEEAFPPAGYLCDFSQ